MDENIQEFKKGKVDTGGYSGYGQVKYGENEDVSSEGNDNNTKETFEKIFDVEKKLYDLKRDTEGFKIKIIEILAIFTALFTFISVEAQILKSSVSFLSALGISLIILGALMFFIFILHCVLNNFQEYVKQNKWLLGAMLFLFICLIAGGVISISYDYSNFTKDINDNFYKKAQIDDLINNQNKKFLLLEDNKELLSIINCLKTKEYWQFNQCFK